MTAPGGLRLNYAFARSKGIALAIRDGQAYFAVRSGADLGDLFEARRVAGEVHPIEMHNPESFDSLLEAIYKRSIDDHETLNAAMGNSMTLSSLIDQIPESTDLLDASDDAPIIKLINGLLYEAINRRASDIHFDPFENGLSIRFRIDGDLVEVLSPPRRLAAPIISRLKVMARLDIADRRLPQDGRMSLAIGGRTVDVRIATLPTRFGERAVLRLLDTRDVRLDLAELGMDEETLARFRDVIRQPNGVVLVTGPVGSGKTTTLYATLAFLKSGRSNLMTLEDPIEYGLPGVSQTQMDHKVGLTFAATLRSVLRQDPNVVMIGEIRDRETANVAFEFSATGRLALSTLHTNSAAGAITRLRDMGVETYLISSTLRAVLAQRLVRQVCQHCCTRRSVTVGEVTELGFSPGEVTEVMEPVGCLACDHTGYKGRLGIYELLVIDPEIRRLISSDASEADVEAVAFSQKDTLLRNARRHIMTGRTTPAEVLRVCRKEPGYGSV
jgi:general secretion pathway protein E